jgi:group I intron endonuclease
MFKKFNYVYITTNLINEKQYVGDRSCNCNPFKDSYIGSGRPAFANAKKKYGKENFKKKILEFFDTKQKAFDAQEKWINEYNTLIPNGYNISPTGGMQSRNGWSNEQKQKMSVTCQGRKLSEEVKRKISNTKKGCVPWNKGKKGISEETRKKMSEASKGHTRLRGYKHSEKTSEKMSLARKGQYPYNKGKKMSDEQKQKISESQKRRHALKNKN